MVILLNINRMMQKMIFLFQNLLEQDISNKGNNNLVCLNFHKHIFYNWTRLVQPIELLS